VFSVFSDNMDSICERAPSRNVVETRIWTRRRKKGCSVIQVADLPALNATLNAIAATLLVCGYVMIRKGRMEAHRRFMLAAFATSALFLVSYLIYHANAGSRPFPGQGPLRIAYFVILVSHVILAAAILPLALITLTHALRERFERHIPIARWTLPIWLYVSVTGVIVYLMLYQMY
jgi:uncharacterized membrane protein YozB (DUF420 family)